MHIREDPDADDTCLVCKSVFIDEEEGPCHELNMCNHMYHAACLQLWVDRLGPGKASCLYCTRIIDDQSGFWSALPWINPDLWKRLAAKIPKPPQRAYDTVHWHWDSRRAAHEVFVQNWANDLNSGSNMPESPDTVQHTFVDMAVSFAERPVLMPTTWCDFDKMNIDWEDDLLEEMMACFSSAVNGAPLLE